MVKHSPKILANEEKATPTTAISSLQSTPVPLGGGGVKIVGCTHMFFVVKKNFVIL